METKLLAKLRRIEGDSAWLQKTTDLDKPTEKFLQEIRRDLAEVIDDLAKLE